MYSPFSSLNAKYILTSIASYGLFRLTPVYLQYCVYTPRWMNLLSPRFSFLSSFCTSSILFLKQII
nr:hypothetical protein GZ19A5_24 [uncultured archaeon GZfos19A5]